MSSTSGITHVSDTALLVAAARALESDDPAGFANDPYAARLAGERGMAIFRQHPNGERMRCGLAVRTRFIDELVVEAVASEQVATVVNLGAGLDTRPWRRDLPEDLRWIEVDFADMLDFKDARMSDQTPRCRRDRLAADLTDASQRHAVYRAIGPAPALMITEGLLMYLPSAVVDALASEPWRASGVAHWVADVVTTAFITTVGMEPPASIQNVRAPDSVSGEGVLEAARRHGWNTKSRRSYVTDIGFAMERLVRLMGARATQLPPEAREDRSGIHRFGRR